MVDWRVPATYAGLEGLVNSRNVTPVLIVIGGATGRNIWGTNSDVDIFAFYQNGVMDPTFTQQEVLDYLGLSHTESDPPIDFKAFNWENSVWLLDPMTKAYPGLKFARCCQIENIFAFPRIFDSTTAESFRTVFLALGKRTIGNIFLEETEYLSPECAADTSYSCSMNWFIWAVTDMLMGAYYIENGVFLSDVIALLTWAGVSISEDTIRNYRGQYIKVSDTTYTLIYNRARTLLINAIASLG